MVGVDISDVHIANARRISEALGAPATWYRCDILDTPHELDGTADLVYTGRGALGWLHDLDGWAAVIARLLKPGGTVSVFDDHPVNWLFEHGDRDVGCDGLRLLYPQRLVAGVAGDLHRRPGRAGGGAGGQIRTPLAVVCVFGALRGAGLVVEHFGEHREEYWDSFPKLKPELKARIPMTFSMLAVAADSRACFRSTRESAVTALLLYMGGPALSYGNLPLRRSTRMQMMDVRAYNREAWNRQVAAGNPWTIPVSSEAVAAARRVGVVDRAHPLDPRAAGVVSAAGRR